MPERDSAVIEVVNHRGFGLAIEFQWCHDRFAHTVFELRPDGVRQPSLHSIEGTEKQRWPSSPPVQHVSLQRNEHHETILGIGMAGHTHWSLSVESIQEPPSLMFDVACRVREVGGTLGSMYRAESSEPELIDHRSCRLEDVICQCQTVGPHTKVTMDATPPNRHFGVRLDADGSVQSPHTFRWQYRMTYRGAPATEDSPTT